MYKLSSTMPDLLELLGLLLVMANLLLLSMFGHGLGNLTVSLR